MRLYDAFILLSVAILIGMGYQKYASLTKPAVLPDFDLTTYWGRGTVDRHKDNNETVLQGVRYGQEPIDELRHRLSGDLGLTAPLEGVNFEYGVNSEWLQEFVDYWRDDYLDRWLERELDFNYMPHYTTYIQG